ncbi:MAG: phosphoribosyl-ATP diphosphatase [Alphaproteobacteria bacterium]|jgi:phosphoribosyl-ATP pyrophosphohydrolase|nr:phosphoribosyl-ATP diphosphatase [Alphaproteobacteria bacterium]MBT4018394.1 phosphoribosyl-ATP diphosphatase [Alphaproteobacteria bacterium]MBT5160107.1 phosphoribosyl-ATP diphosphatase [Alphaproteobacteria bacterium]MBT5919615.1 phosphoribosyl-ATP diphosphatase [Alphaproteobacteria bacterium]MBT6387214.1 phosphoribosyl-ATP diphosphatase [Alphaproteobacteria bacterium]
MTEQTSVDARMLDRLFDVIEGRKSQDADKSYVASLYKKGRQKIAQKVGEEAVETVIAAIADDRAGVVNESADLLFHLMVLWADSGVCPDDIYLELARREGLSGLDEKTARKQD